MLGKKKHYAPPVRTVIPPAVEPIIPTTESQLVSELLFQRDAALRELNDIANIRKTLTMIGELSVELRQAVEALQDARNVVRGFLSGRDY